eukprot:11249710-Heterocapsa_arctica.AAC.1
MIFLNCKDRSPLRGKGTERALQIVNSRCADQLYGPAEAGPGSAGNVSLCLDTRILNESWRRVYRNE